MTSNLHIENAAILWMILGAVLAIAAPVCLTAIWIKRKREPFSTVFIGAVTFLLFAIILEKPIQNVLIFPTVMGLPDQAISRFLNANPVLLALAAGLFPGLFEETGRLVAYKTVLRKRRNKETSISHGIGHGGFEVMFLLGITYIQYIAYAVMINNGTFQSLVAQIVAQAPEQAANVSSVVNLLTAFSASDLAMSFMERIFAVMFHVGASILVFYACQDRAKLWLYPLAILLHTALDFIAALSLFGVITLSPMALNGFAAFFGALTFFGAYFLLYQKDVTHSSLS